MKPLVLRYGLIAAAVLIGVNLLVLLLTGLPGPEDYARGEVVGYATIIVALVPVFFAIRHYREEVAGGVLSFGQGVRVGLVVSLVPSAAFALYNLLYVKVIDPGFAETYLAYTLASARETMASAEFERYEAELTAQAVLLTDPFVQALVMFLTVLLVGLVVSTISSMLLRRSAAAGVPSARPAST